jgi:hypothetical protein
VCATFLFLNVSSFVWSFVCCWPVLYFFVATESLVHVWLCDRRHFQYCVVGGGGFLSSLFYT